MSALDRLIPTPRMIEIDSVELALPADRAWDVVRHSNLGRSLLIRTLFALRTSPGRLFGEHGAELEPLRLRLDDLQSSSERPGFQILVDDPPFEVAVGAIGKVWKLDIPFTHVPNAEAFASFTTEGFVKVAWALRVERSGAEATRVVFEVRVDATDEASWRKFRRYFRVIGVGSHFIRRSLLSALVREYGTPKERENLRALAGDALVADAAAQVTDAVTIAAKPEEIWPWLVQMGCRRAGFYSIDVLDNAGVRSAREIHRDLQVLRVGDVLPATPHSQSGEVLRIEPNHSLVLGGLYDMESGQQLPFGAPRPPRYWHVSWSFELEPLDAYSTRLHARARAAFPSSGRIHAAAIRPVHHLMQEAQLEHLAALVEGRAPHDDWRDVAQGFAGAAIMTAALLTPFLRDARNHWGVDEATANRRYPGDELVSEPRWSWTHGIEIDATTDEVWPWIAQIGADRAGFYSYQWLENVVGCNLRNAETVHTEWSVERGGALLLHPKAPPLSVVEVAPGRHFVAFAKEDASARESGKPWAAASWLFHLEPLGPRRCRLISRYRCASSDDVATRLALGPALMEPIGFAMDRRMLLGIKERAERASKPARSDAAREHAPL